MLIIFLTIRARAKLPMFGDDFNHTLGNLLICLDVGCVGNAREDVRIEGEALMCHDIGASKIMNMRASMCLERGKAQGKA